MHRPFALLALLGTLSPCVANACDVQTESRAVQRLYVERAATLPHDVAATVGSGLVEAGRLHEVGKNQEACERFQRLHALLTPPPTGQNAAK